MVSTVKNMAGTIEDVEKRCQQQEEQTRVCQRFPGVPDLQDLLAV